jgi:predicted nucleic acid-binding protein
MARAPRPEPGARASLAEVVGDRLYDALYLAIADAGGAHVLTCDGRLSRAPGTGVPVENVRVT